MSERSNIVLVSWDSVRADHIPIYGYERNTTPTLNSIAENGVVFEDVQIPAVGTPASFTGMFTGEHTTGSMEHLKPEHWKQANQERTFLTEHLQEAGYHTGGFHFNALVSSSFGWDRGWDIYNDRMWTDTDDDGVRSGWKQLAHEGLKRTNLANLAVDAKRIIEGVPPARWESLWDDVAQFIESAPEPFFLWVLLLDTHHPYYAPEEYHEWPQPGLRTTYALNYLMHDYPNLVGERRPSVVNAYDNTIRYADAFVDRLRGTLDDSGYGSDPLIIHSDHGDEFGEHGNYGHRPQMYDTVTRVPLVMENVGETGRVNGPTSLLDLASTILDLADVEERPGDRPSLLEDERVDREYVTVQNVMEDGGRIAAVVGPEWKVLYYPAGDWGIGSFSEERWEAYHRESDPLEQNNRWGEHPEELESALIDLLETEAPTESPEAEGDGEMTVETEKRLRELGYIE
jgi:arylsulfatase